MADENVKEKTTETSAAQKRTESFGSYKEHTIDAKNRLFIPAKMRNKLGSTFRVFCPIDGSDCLTIPTEFCDFAGLKKNVVVAGVGKRLEIWDADKYYKTMERARNIRQTFDYSQIQF